jgi:peptide/nickel transport system permease protein
MLRYFIVRLLHGLLLLASVSLLTFALLQLAPGDFFAEMRLNPQITSESVAALRHQYGLDRSVATRYLLWIDSVRKGELGFSFAYDSPVASLLWTRARNTLVLTLTAMLLSWLIAVPVGVLCAAKPSGWSDRFCLGATSSLLAIPDLLLALGLLCLAVRTGWFPTGGMVSPGFNELSRWDKVRDVVSHFCLPVATLVLGAVPVLLRHVRAGVAEVLASPFIRAARAHGIPRRRLLARYALRGAAVPLISLFGLAIATLLSGSLLVEVIMSWPGMGPLLWEAVLARDVYVVVGAVMCSTLFLVGGNMVADALLFAVDPRIRRE